MNRDLAIQEFLKASALMEQKNYKDALSIFFSIQPALSDTSALYFNIAQIQYQLEEYGSAIENIDIALDLDLKPKYMKLKFELLQKVSRYKQAIELGSDLLELDLDIDVATNLAYLNLRENNYEKAVTIFDDLHALDQLDPTSRFTLGVLKYQSKQYDEAIHHLKKVIEEGHSKDEAMKVLVAAFEQSGNIEAGINYLSSMDSLSSAQLFSLAKLYKNNDQPQRAEIILNDLLGFDRKIEYLTFYGHLLREQKEFEQALEYYNEVIEEEEDNLGAIKGSALCMMELGRHEEANELFEVGERINRGGEMPDFDNMLLNLDVLEGSSEGLFGTEKESKSE